MIPPCTEDSVRAGPVGFTSTVKETQQQGFNNDDCYNGRTMPRHNDNNFELIVRHMMYAGKRYPPLIGSPCMVLILRRPSGWRDYWLLVASVSALFTTSSSRLTVACNTTTKEVIRIDNNVTIHFSSYFLVHHLFQPLVEVDLVFEDTGGLVVVVVHRMRAYWKRNWQTMQPRNT